MSLDITTLPSAPEKLKSLITALQADNTELLQDNSELQQDNVRLQSQVELLEEKLRLFNRDIYCPKSEKGNKEVPGQLSMFNEAESLVDEDLEPDSSSEETPVKSHTRKKRGRKPLPADLPRIEVIHDIPESEKICGCGAHLSRIGEEVAEKLEIIPAKLQVIKHIRYKYACKSCEGVDDDGATVKIAPVPAQILPKSMASESLAAHILVSKFEYALPLYRQEKIFKALGIDIPRATMANWAVKIGAKLEPLMELLRQQLTAGALINIDETPVQVLREPDRKNTTKSYMWVFRGGATARPGIVFQYHPSRAGEVPRKFLGGYQGYIQTDSYRGYDWLDENKNIIHLACWAHARRKFNDVIKARKKAKGAQKKKNSIAEKILNHIAKLYKVEKHVREHQLSPEKIVQVRQERSKPILNKLHAYLQEKKDKTPPAGLLGKAISYTLKNWPRLTRYLEKDYLRPDNNLAENAIRPFVVGRKNWLFCGHPNGAHASAAIYSLMETAKANSLVPYNYFLYLFNNLPMAENREDYLNLLPQNLTAQKIEPPKN